jgi:hypothetical protein
MWRSLAVAFVFAWGLSVTATGQVARTSKPNESPAPWSVSRAGKLVLAQVGLCTQERPAPTLTCHCTRPDGSKFDVGVSEYYCYNPSSGQRCGGPYGQSCNVACDPHNTTPAPHGCQ